MRLLDVRNFTLIEPSPSETPKYAIASHRWKRGEEASMKDIVKGRNKRKSGYKKVKGFARYVQDHLPGINYLWVDTCCINQLSDPEISESVNSMFRWYRDAAICLVYLADVHHADDLSEFKSSAWHTRGWTLQELLAPRRVLFLTSDWQTIGWKSDDRNPDHRPVLRQTLSQITSIPEDVLDNYEVARRFDIGEKLYWSSFRETTKPEDKVYSLFGLFDVAMPVIYGEGADKAQQRLSAAVREAAPNLRRMPVAVLPTARDIDHVDRPELQELLDNALSAKAARIALVGVRGAGKSQLALEYAYRIRQLRPHIWVLWMDASNDDDLKRSAENIARRIQIPGYEAPGVHFPELVQNWLSDKHNGAWILVLDTSNEIDALLTPSDLPSENGARDWLKHIPVCDHGSVITTGRSAGSPSVDITGWRVIDITAMDIESATKLLRAKLGDFHEEDDVKQLASALTRTPLELIEAGSYVQKHAPRLTIQRHLASIRIEKVHHESRSAAELLSFMSLCDHNAIPEYLVCIGATDETSTALDGEAFQSDIKTLRNLSLIFPTDEANTWQMQQDAQCVIRNWLTDNQTIKEYTRRFAHRLRCVTPSTAGSDNWAKCRTLLPHAKCALHLKPSDRMALVAWVDTLQMFVGYLQSQGQDEDAKAFARAVFQISEDEIVFHSSDNLAIAGRLAFSFWKMGHYEEALNLLERTMAVSKDMVGEKHETTLLLMDYLSGTYYSLNRHEEAVALGERWLELEQQVHAFEHSDRLMAMHNLALKYIKRGKYQDAADLLDKTIATRKAALGEKHSATLASMQTLAFVMSRQGQCEKAMELESQVVALSFEVLGPDHLETIMSMDYLAQTYNLTGRYEQAAQMYAEVVEKRTRLLGPNHAKTLDAVKELAWIKRKMEKVARKKLLDGSQDAAQADSER